jgi:hypothetical protein
MPICKINSPKDRRLLLLALASCLSVWASQLALPAHGAQIGGVVVTSTGAPLERAPVCLQASTDEGSCIKVRYTDRKGAYSFTGLKASTVYRLSIFSDKSAAARKFDEYKTYIFSPALQSVSVTKKNDRLTADPFEGKFNFSNYQRVIELVSADFPELSQIDISAQTVFLKVSYQPNTAPDAVPETIFLGQLVESSQLQLKASIPLAVTAIDYEIFSSTFATGGRIDLES